MKLAFTTLACPGWSVEEVAERAPAMGYDGIELRLLGADLIPPDLPPAKRRRVRDVFDRAGLSICCVDTSARFAAATPEERRANEELALRFLELAADWGSPLIRVFGGNPPADVPFETVAGSVADSLARIARRGEQVGVTTVLETHDAFSAGAAVAAVLARVDSPFVGALWDTHHPYRMGETAAQTLGLLGGRLRHVHIKDARRQGDGWQLVLLGEGEVPVAEALRAIQAGGYDGWYSVEWEKKWHPEIPEPEVALPQHVAVLRRWLGA